MRNASVTVVRGRVVSSMIRNVNEIRPTYSPEFKKIFGNNFSNLKNTIEILKNAAI